MADGGGGCCLAIASRMAPAVKAPMIARMPMVIWLLSLATSPVMICATPTRPAATAPQNVLLDIHSLKLMGLLLCLNEGDQDFLLDRRQVAVVDGPLPL